MLTAIATAAVIAVALYLAYLAAQSGSEAPPAEPPTGSPPLNLTERGGVVNYSSYGRFAVELYRRVALQRIDRNLVISPYTVYKAFATAYAGASGATREEMLEAADVAVLMGGGPARTYATEFRKALEEFSNRWPNPHPGPPKGLQIL
ncbi:MAG: serpin family protein [Pyrobaculum sp.]